MKNPIKYIFPAVIFLLAFSCEKNEPIKKTDDKCGESTAKLVRIWCSSNSAVIEILSDKSIGEDWFGILGKTHHHAVLALLDSTLSKANEDWSKAMNQSDSVFYFNYVLKQIEYPCKVCCPPITNILITSFAPHPCSTNN